MSGESRSVYDRAFRAKYDRAFRAKDVMAVVVLAWGAFFVLRGETLEMTRPTGPAMYTLSALAFVFAVLLPVMLRAVLRKAPRGEDEYLRKLLGISAISGFYCAFAVFVVWTPLSGTLLPDLRGPQVLGLMLGGAALSWFAQRWRDAR